MSKFYFNNVQKKQSEMKGKCSCKVAKYFTKCLFYSWLIKICIGLYLLFSSFVHHMFCKCSNFHPRGLQLSPRAPSTASCLCLEATTTHVDFIFVLSSDQHLSHHVKVERRYTFTTGKHSTVSGSQYENR